MYVKGSILFSQIALWIFLISTFIPGSINIQFYYFPYVLLLASIFILLNEKVYKSGYFWWRFLFVLGSLFSFWLIAINKEEAFQYFKYVLLQTIALIQIFLLAQKIKIRGIIKIFLLAVSVFILYILVIADFSKLATMRLGADVLGKDWNANDVGKIMSIAFLFSMFLKKYDFTLKKKHLSYLSIFQFILFILVLMSGSRTAFMIFLVGFFGMLLTNANTMSKKVRNLIVGMLIVSIITFLSIKIPFLYNTIGNRISHLFTFLSTNVKQDASLGWREIMIMYGMFFFRQRPIFGYGINCYKVLFGYYYPFYATYSHNNYIEMLVDGGVVGCCLYYLIFITNFYYIYRYKSKYRKPMFIILAVILLADISMISYVNFTVQFAIMCATLLIRNELLF